MGNRNDIRDEPAKSIFLDAREIASPDARAAYLDRRCGDDHRLRGEVETFLRHHSQLGDYLEHPACDPGSTHDLSCRPRTEGPGTLIGPYKLIEQVGEGGMGVVYVAEQTAPVRRKVALKVIKPGMDSRQVIARFEAERQALAMMDHSNIAKVHDGGTTESGRPYFVMELVRGLPITEYCDGDRLSIRERLKLFVLVCRAVQHAHQKGIIHRDLKPSNILVTLHDGVPVPKVIDFGVAKATGQSLTEKTVYTGFTQLVGTPLYMSPEQVELSGLDIDTRSDIYSLGVLLYELLTGTTPFGSEALKKAAFDEMRRIIRDDQPPTPSMRLSTLGETLSSTSMKRSSDPSRLNRSVRGELDWIAMKALEKDRTRRYETANDLATDVLRYLTDQPVEACPPSTWYRLRKFARRNRAAITTATVVAAALVIGMAFNTWQAMLARRAEADTQAFSDFLVDDILAVARPEGVQGGLGVDVTVAQALEAADAKLEERFAGRPLAEATARNAIGATWRNLTKYERAERHLRRAVELREQELGPDDPATLESPGNSLGVLLSQTGRSGEAIVLHKETLEKFKAKLGPDDPHTLKSMNNLAMAYSESGQFDRARSLHEVTLRKRQVTLGLDHPDTLKSMNNLAMAFVDSGKLDQALPLLKLTLEKRQSKLGPDHPDTLQSIDNLATTNNGNGRLAEALPFLKLSMERRKAKFGPDHTVTLDSMTNLALAFSTAGKSDLALPLLEQTFQKRKAKFGPGHPQMLGSMNNLALALLTAGKPDQALPLLEELLEHAKVKLGPDHRNTLISMDNLARSYQAADKLDQAIKLHEQTLRMRQAKLPTDHPQTLQSMNNLASAYFAAGKLELALPLFEHAFEKLKAKLGIDNTDTLVCMSSLANCYGQLGQPEKAEPIFRESAKIWKDKAGADSPQYGRQLAVLGLNQLKQQKPADAEPLLRECLTIREKTEPDVFTTFNTKSMLGGSLLGQKKYAEAEPLLLAGYEGLMQREEKIPTPHKIRVTEAIERLVQLYDV